MEEQFLSPKRQEIIPEEWAKREGTKVYHIPGSNLNPIEKEKEFKCQYLGEPWHTPKERIMDNNE